MAAALFQTVFIEHGLGKRRGRFSQVHWIVLQEKRLFSQNVAVIGMSQLVGQRRHAVGRVRIRHEDPRLLSARKPRAETSLPFSGAVLDLDPATGERSAGEFSEVGGERL